MLIKPGSIVTYEHRRRFEEIAERIMEQVEHGAGVQVGETTDLAREERHARTCAYISSQLYTLAIII